MQEKYPQWEGPFQVYRNPSMSKLESSKSYKHACCHLQVVEWFVKITDF